jgi:hypothetical protein
MTPAQIAGIVFAAMVVLPFTMVISAWPQRMHDDMHARAPALNGS